MKILILLSVVIGTLASIEFAREWNSFKAEYGKKYRNEKEELQRQKIYLENKKVIEAHNKLYNEGKVSFKLRVNQFSDMDPDEFKGFTLGNKRLRRHVVSDKPSLHVASSNNIPETIDWRTLNPKAVSPVQSTDFCESSYAVSAIAALVGQLWLRKTIEVPPLSAQNIIDCSGPFGNSGCEGGTVENAFNYIKNNGGLDSEESYPTVNVDYPCQYNATNLVSSATVTGYVEIQSGNESALMDAVANIGPVAVSVGAADNTFLRYGGGVYDPDPATCSIKLEDRHHVVLLVGYGSEGGKNFWIIQNTWGPSWGEGGYMRLVRNGKNTCGIATVAVYPTV